MRSHHLLAGLALLAGPAFAQDLSIPFGDGSVTVEPGGTIGRFLLDADWKKEFEARRRLASGEAPAVWTTKIFILRRIDAPWKDETGADRHTAVAMDDARVATFRRIAEGFVEAIGVLTGGRVRLEAEIVVLEEPLRTLDVYGRCIHPWSDAMDPLLAPHVPAGQVDSVLVYWSPGDLPHENYWGLTSWGICRGAGYSWVVDLGGEIDERAYVEVSIHEWLHQLEAVRTGILGYAGLPWLHDGTKMGYRPDERHPGWMLWYRDFLTTYMTPAMWARSNPRSAAADRPRARFEGGFVDEWLVGGPFDNADDRGLEREIDGEADLAPATPDWRKVTGAPRLDLDSILAPNEAVVGYAHVYVRSNARREAILWVGSDDGVVVRMNGREVWRNHVHRGTAPDQDRVPVLLKEGWNRFLFKVDEGNGAWGLLARFSTPAGDPIPDLAWSAEKPVDGSIVGFDAEPLPESARWTVVHHDWRAVSGDPWRLLRELGEAELRRILRAPELRLSTGDHWTAVLVGGARPTGGERRLDGTIDFARESLARVRFERDGVARDLVLVRPDVAPFWLARLDAFDDPSVAAIGRVTAGGRPLVAIETRLAVDVAPTELHLARSVDSEIAANLLPERGVVAAGERLRGLARLVNLGERPAALLSVGLEGGPELSGPIELAPFETREIPFEDEGSEPGPRRLVLVVGHAHGTIRDLAVVDVKKPLEVSIEAPRTGRLGRSMPVRARVANHRGEAVSCAIALQPPPGWRIEGEVPPTVDVPPGGSIDLGFAVLPAGTPAGETVALSVEARTPTGEPASAAARWKRSPWLLAGPYDNADRKGFSAAYPPETGPFDGWFELVPAGATATAAEVDHLAIFEPREWQVAYAAADLVAEKTGRATLRFGSDDTLTVWLDGTLLVARDVYRPAAPGQDVVEVDLTGGRHRLVVKVAQGYGGWKMFFDTPTEGVVLEPAR